MSIHAALTHRTSYRYDRLVGMSPQLIRLRPAPHCRTPILSYTLDIAPKPHFLNWVQDPQGNFIARVVFPERVREFVVTVDLLADMATINPFDFFVEPEAEAFPFAYDPVLAQELAPFRRVSAPGPLLEAYLKDIPRSAPSTINHLVDLNQKLSTEIGYIVRMEPGVWTPEEVLANRKGSCRDSGWLLVQILRHLGFAARFVSGYLIQLVPDVKAVAGPVGTSVDFTDLHAWCEVYVPGAGWIGLDPTSGLLAGEGHIPLAATPEPASAAPITGGVDEAETEFGFHMEVRRVAQSPRVTKPYAEADWARIMALGSTVDRALEAGDVRLTVGGEPTFVAEGDRDAAEWNTDALGPTKRPLAGRLLRRLQPLWAPGAALTYAQGKWYPGEPLPRWGLHCHWRADGEPVWTDPALLASDDDTDTATAADAAAFAAALAGRLGLDPALRIPAREDVHYYLWKEKMLPANVLAEDAKLKDPLERARLARLFGQGLAAEVGSVLPLRRAGLGEARAWESGKWAFRDGELFLIPGDSPMGFRLPLDSLPWASEASIEAEPEPDPFARREPLRPRREGGERARIVEQPVPEPGREEPGVVRTALCVEPRGGLLHVFLPPFAVVQDWLDLVAAIEATARDAGRKVFLEGYLPPHDPRLLNFSVTPDPGVIEVNVHPSASWAETSARTEQLYEEARQIGLAAEKFMLDGRHVGTGGGNHMVMGAATPAESPFLRRPDLLKSLVGFWHNHPSLSYLFSGLFIGPTSQHPRVDEARGDAVHELETALAQVPPAGTVVPPWLTDRIFRNLLVDMTGNTHRTEFCIDKMYDPGRAGGRLGLVEFRGFEMQPHWRMSLAQQLLLRSLVAGFWQRPYGRRLVKWGTRLHDDFMLHHHARQDFAEVIEEVKALGFPVQAEWFEPHFEFRFPKVGQIALRGMELELRNALEPWHVLGEEVTAAGTTRYVDSSVERLQARVTGWVEERFVLACNGLQVPLAPTGTEGEYVAGIRFKAWDPPSALHPTVRAQAPLTFDVWDSWSGRSLGGCQHHVAHPGGRNYQTFPVNANEAEARRRALFQPFGHTPGAMPPPRQAASRATPRTLDLRRAASS
ncbi:transglutaminase family protein [Falsiroseomonas selenitidurans]|uniref:Transglutaminase family protein n=1 Tax=Falsiroseomonas selenitidurans TaxID=2716335 RepID=A0ABX1E167_9PROT|nr:transglutaminase family protein [Falsiroseomonas selenitidurans]NKC30899.1 transglutaminase family protein [Falsiroseomonas selenitidurans]